jgi:hypothetical protein
MSVSDVFNAVNTFKNPLGQLGQVRQAVSGVTNTIGDIQRVFGIGGNKNPASFGGTYNVMSSMSARKDPLPLSKLARPLTMLLIKPMIKVNGNPSSPKVQRRSWD